MKKTKQKASPKAAEFSVDQIMNLFSDTVTIHSLGFIFSSHFWTFQDTALWHILLTVNQLSPMFLNIGTRAIARDFFHWKLCEHDEEAYYICISNQLPPRLKKKEKRKHLHVDPSGKSNLSPFHRGQFSDQLYKCQHLFAGSPSSSNCPGIHVPLN